MGKILLIGFLVLCSVTIYPGKESNSEKKIPEKQHKQMIDFDRNVNWLSSMMRTVKKNKKTYALVQSYDNIPDRCWIYDEALAIMAFTALGRTDMARKILDTLQLIQNQDGSFYFSYIISGLEPTTDRKYTGTIAWLAVAINFYRNFTGDKSYIAMQWRILNWLASQQVVDKTKPAYGGVSLGVRDDAFSMEHNLDTYSAFYFYGNRYFRKRAKLIKKFILTNLYKPSANPHFITGYKDNSLYLDCQSWAVLALGKKYCPVLSFAEKKFLVRNGSLNGLKDIQGFFERKAGNAPVWSEGTEGVALAFYYCGNPRKANFYHQQVKRMMGENGGIVYATENQYEFSTYPSVAGTTWYIFFEMKINPFKPNRKTRRSARKFLKKYSNMTK